MNEVEQIEHGLWRHRVGFGFIATFLLFVCVLLPFTVASVVDELLGPPEGHVFRVPEDAAPPAPTHTRLHIAVAALDDFQQLATLRVSRIGFEKCT